MCIYGKISSKDENWQKVVDTVMVVNDESYLKFYDLNYSYELGDINKQVNRILKKVPHYSVNESAVFYYLI